MGTAKENMTKRLHAEGAGGKVGLSVFFRWWGSAQGSLRPITPAHVRYVLTHTRDDLFEQAYAKFMLEAPDDVKQAFLTAPPEPVYHTSVGECDNCGRWTWTRMDGLCEHCFSQEE